MIRKSKLSVTHPEITGKYDELVWKTTPTALGETVQVSDNYVVHGRGFVIQNDIWFDEYAITMDHMNVYNNHVVEAYDKPGYGFNHEYESWPEYVDHEFDEDEDIPLYFSVDGTGLFTLDHPRASRMDGESWHRLHLLMQAMDAEQDQRIKVYREPPGSRGSHAQSILRSLDRDIDKSVTFTAQDLADTYNGDL